ncbi:energy transducer TonB [Bacteroides reticulotermitis]|uniref:energy transducer TonB n=1 Tax=Bacteroides reticulotermitis TaxID=1133319 RepID=UPI003A89A0F9
MKVDKRPERQFRRENTIWLLLGYAIVLSLMLVAFEEIKRNKILLSQMMDGQVIEEDIDVMRLTSEQRESLLAECVGVNMPVYAGEHRIPGIAYAGQVGPVRVKRVRCTTTVRVAKEDPEEIIYEIVDNMPDFPGGQAALMKFLAKNIKYPVIAQENDVQGRVIVQFVVNKNGRIVGAKVVRGVDSALDVEALRVINSMPDWKPGMQHGKPVRVRLTIPVIFRLR